MTAAPKGKVQDAFARTAAHPADRRVRIAAQPEDLAAIQTPGVKAVIWEREMPGDIEEVLKEESRLWTKGWLNPTPIYKAAAFQRDDARLQDIFEKAVGMAPEDMNHIDALMYNRKNLLPGLDGPPYDLPHIDGFTVRLACIYSLDRTYGTEWYPGHVAPKLDDMRHAVEYAVDRGALKRGYNAQHTLSGQVLLLKGRNCTDRREHLVHNGPEAKTNVLRLGRLLGTTRELKVG